MQNDDRTSIQVTAQFEGITDKSNTMGQLE
jgi:hypothetical protein